MKFKAITLLGIFLISPTLLANQENISSPSKCKIACYSREHKDSLYQLSGTPFYVMGAIKVAGKYNNQNVCVPQNTNHDDISKSVYFQELCMEHFKGCKRYRCWAGGDAKYTASINPVN